MRQKHESRDIDDIDNQFNALIQQLEHRVNATKTNRISTDTLHSNRQKASKKPQHETCFRLQPLIIKIADQVNMSCPIPVKSLPCRKKLLLYGSNTGLSAIPNLFEGQ